MKPGCCQFESGRQQRDVHRFCQPRYSCAEFVKPAEPRVAINQATINRDAVANQENVIAPRLTATGAARKIRLPRCPGPVTQACGRKRQGALPEALAGRRRTTPNLRTRTGEEHKSTGQFEQARPSGGPRPVRASDGVAVRLAGVTSRLPTI